MMRRLPSTFWNNPNLIRKGPSIVRPQVSTPTRVDFTHPFMHGIKGLWLPDNSNEVLEVVQNKPFALLETPPTDEYHTDSTAFGPCVRHVGLLDSGPIFANDPNDLYFPDEKGELFLFGILEITLGIGGKDTPIIYKQTNYEGYTLAFSATDKTMLARIRTTASTKFTTTAGPAPFVLNQLSTFAFTFRPSDGMTLYCNGEVVSNNPSAGTFRADISTQQPVRLLTTNVVSGYQNFEGFFYMAMMGDRFKSKDEVFEMMRDPYAFLVSEAAPNPVPLILGAVGPAHDLLLEGSVSSSAAEIVAVPEDHTFVVDTHASTSVADSYAVIATHELLIVDAVSGAAVPTLALGFPTELALVEPTAATNADTVVAALEHDISTDDAVSAPVADGLLLIQTHPAQVEDAVSASVAGTISFTTGEEHNLRFADVVATSASDPIIIAIEHDILTGDARSPTRLDGIVLTADHLIALKDVISASNIDTIDVGGTHQVVFPPTFADSVAEEIAFTTENAIFVQLEGAAALSVAAAISKDKQAMIGFADGVAGSKAGTVAISIPIFGEITNSGAIFDSVERGFRFIYTNV